MTEQKARYALKVVNADDLYWNGDIDRPYVSRYEQRTKCILPIEEGWWPRYVHLPKLIGIKANAVKLLVEYEGERQARGRPEIFKELCLEAFEYRPRSLGVVAMDGLDARYVEGRRLFGQFGTEMAEHYLRLQIPEGEDIYFPFAVRRKGKSFELIKKLEKGYHHGPFTFFRSRAEVAHARLVLGDMIKRVYDLTDKYSSDTAEL
jgi:hypothetical protein